ncbi:MAG: hypothetical protein ABSE62_05095 [Chthoniobacteraceae bacterium]|jgi:hypothetical protein
MDVPVGIKNAAFKAGLDEMKSQAAGFAGSVSSLFAGIGLGAMFAGAMDRAKDVEEVSKKFGDTAENVQKLGNAVKLMGGDMDTVSKGGFKAFLEAQKALSGDKAAEKHFADLGISMEKLQGLTGPRDTILALADAVHGAADQHAALAAAGDLVGTRQASLINLFRAGREEIERLGDAFPVMSNQAVSDLAAAQIRIEKFKESLTVWAGETLEFFNKAAQGVGILWAEMHGHTQDQIAGDLADPNGTQAQILDLMQQEVELKEELALDKSHGRSAFITDPLEQQIAALKQQREALQGVANQETKDDSETPAAPTGDADDGEADAAAAKEDRAEEEAGRKAEEAGEKRKRIADEIADLQEKHRLAAMTGEQKLTELIADRDNAQLVNSVKFALSLGLDDQQEGELNVLKLQERIDAQQKENAEGKARDAKEAADKQAEADKKLADSQADEAKEIEDRKLKTMTPKQQRDYFKKKEDMLWYDADQAERKGDRLTGADKRTEALKTQDQIDAIDDPAKAKGPLSVKVDSMRAIGGGGRIGQSGDPALRQLERQTGALEDIKQSCRDMAGRGGSSAHERAHPAHPK